MNITNDPTVVSSPHKRKTAHRLNPWQLRDWFRILVWVFFNPARINIHHNLYGHHAMKRTAGWLIATLVTGTLGLLVSPLLIDPYLAHRFAENYRIAPDILLIAALALGGSIGLLSYIENELSLGLVYGIAFGLAFGMTGVIAFGVMGDFTNGLGLIIGASVALGIIFGLAEVIILRVAYIVAGIFAVGMTFGVAGVLIFTIAIVVSMTTGNALRRNVTLGRPTSTGIAVLLIWLTSVLMMVGSVLTLIS